MQLSHILSRKFSNTTRQRGYDYYRQRRVRIDNGSTSQVDATVLGSEPYLVMLHWTGNSLAVLCECPYFTGEDQLCKHLWATILASDEDGYLSEASAAKDIALDMDSLLLSVSAQVGDPEFSLPEFKNSPKLKPLPSKFNVFFPPPKPPKPPQPPAWKTQLNRIVAAPSTASAQFPADAEILYVVDIPRSLATTILVLSLSRW